MIATRIHNLYLLVFLVVFSSAVYLENNGYKGIQIIFSPSVRYEEVNIENLKLIFQESSERLFHATRRRAYFSEIILNVPFTWPKRFCKGISTTEYSSHTADIYVTNSNKLSHFFTQHGKGCGEKGEAIYVPVSWFKGSAELLSREFIQQWAIFRYGVFEELPLHPGSCYTKDGKTWSPAGCYSAQILSEMTLDSNGLPKCDFPDDSSSTSSMKSSIMFSTDLPNITDFCDGSDSFSHSAVNPTLHNNLCNERPVWKVIEKAEDFEHGKNPPILDDFFNPQLMFKCYYEQENPNVLIAVQNSSIDDKTELVTELRFTLQRFFLYDISSNVESTLLTFSDESHTKETAPVDLNLKEPQIMKSVLKERIRVASTVDTVCVTCALEKIISVLNDKVEKNGIVIFITLASAFEATSAIEFKTVFKDIKKKFYMIVIQDSLKTTVLGEILTTVFGANGQVFLIPDDLVLVNIKISMILAGLLKNIGQDVFVIHQATYSNITTDVVEKFQLDGEVEGQLLYTLKCNTNEQLNMDGSNCTALMHLSTAAYTCGNNSTLESTNESKSWEFKFPYLKGIRPLTCSSLATVKIKASQRDIFFLNGWLSRYEVTPKENTLIIYALVLKDYVPISNVKVEAHIYSPSNKLVVTELRDNGNGDPDVKKEDGIHSRYFVGFDEKGIYSVLIRATGYKSFDFSEFHSEADVEFSRVMFIGSFNLLNDAPDVDIYPPNRIADLHVLAVNHENFTVTLEWTAPGNDYDNGQVVSYTVRIMEMSLKSVDENSLNMGFALQPVNKNELLPSESGKIEKVMFQITPRENEAIFNIFIRSKDKNFNLGERSNVVQVYIKGTRDSTTVFPTEYSTTLKWLSTHLTDAPIENKTNLEVTDSDLNDNATFTTAVSEITTNNSNPNCDCSDSDYVVLLASSIGGGLLLLIIIVNIIICFLFIRKRNPTRNKKFSRQASMRPPYNMSIQPRSSNTSDSTHSFGDNQKLDDMILANQSPEFEHQLHILEKNNSFRNSRDHVDRIRAHPSNHEYQDYREGYQIVTATPAYASVNLNWQHRDTKLTEKNKSTQFSLPETQQKNLEIYALGTV